MRRAATVQERKYQFVFIPSRALLFRDNVVELFVQRIGRAVSTFWPGYSFGIL